MKYFIGLLLLAWPFAVAWWVLREPAEDVVHRADANDAELPTSGQER